MLIDQKIANDYYIRRNMSDRYNAGITSYDLWLNEFKICLSLRAEGKSVAEIKKASDESNVFEMSSRDRARRASRNLTERMMALPEDIIELFPLLDIENQKLVALLSMMLTNRLLNEFVCEVYRNEVVFGNQVFEERDMNEFITRKQIESKQISNWTNETTKRVSGSLKTILRDAGLLKKRNNDADMILRPIIDLRLIKLMKKNHLTKSLRALGG